MKLFLTSLWLLPEFREPLKRLVGKPLDQVAVALIENGADDEPGEPRWVKRARDSLTNAGMKVTQLDLRQYTGGEGHDQLREALRAADVIWVGGGNTFYLNWILADSGARDMIIELAQAGKVYAGGSAGSIVAGPTVKGFETADDASFAPKLALDGLALTDTVVVPHWGRNDYDKIMADISEHLTSAGYHVQPLTDREVLVVDENSKHVISA